MIDHSERLQEGTKRYGTVENAVDEKQALRQWFKANLRKLDKLSGAEVALEAVSYGFSETLVKRVLPGLLTDHALGEMENATDCQTCDHPKSSHNDYGGKCATCGCRSYLQNAKTFTCPECGERIVPRAEGGPDDVYECEGCGRMYETDDWRSDRLKPMNNASERRRFEFRDANGDTETVEATSLADAWNVLSERMATSIQDLRDMKLSVRELSNAHIGEDICADCGHDKKWHPEGLECRKCGCTKFAPTFGDY